MGLVARFQVSRAAEEQVLYCFRGFPGLNANFAKSKVFQVNKIEQK